METITKFFKEEKDYLFKKGERKRSIDIARELKKEGLSAEFIAKTTKIPIAEIEKL
ncbi:hypothetical protein [Parapedobacter sp. 10938]|uniref:hypothetical protein n=1 Tax=Parapedobacter flavus TaxID=3110225 RepID=UPI002DBA2407|nr:hypothetical protein [Parapedobacter sp. 10938]MEC3881800.1 hypothetical protein [Parapedobacter sp. 10938]